MLWPVVTPAETHNAKTAATIVNRVTKRLHKSLGEPCPHKATAMAHSCVNAAHHHHELQSPTQTVQAVSETSFSVWTAETALPVTTSVVGVMYP